METIKIRLSQNYLQIISQNLTLGSKLIDGRFPNYKRLVSHEGDKVLTINREALKQALMRTAILSNEKFRGIRLQLRSGLLNVSANNPEQEEAEEIIHIDYEGGDFDIGFNVVYLLDAINVFDDCEDIKLTFKDADSSVKIEEAHTNRDSLTLVMPIKLI
jgi:DNA polymerase-3 subunit beta